MPPVCGGRPPVEQARGGQRERSRAQRQDASAPGVGPLERADEGARWLVLDTADGHHDGVRGAERSEPEGGAHGDAREDRRDRRGVGGADDEPVPGHLEIRAIDAEHLAGDRELERRELVGDNRCHRVWANGPSLWCAGPTLRGHGPSTAQEEQAGVGAGTGVADVRRSTSPQRRNCSPSHRRGNETGRPGCRGTRCCPAVLAWMSSALSRANSAVRCGLPNTIALPSFPWVFRSLSSLDNRSSLRWDVLDDKWQKCPLSEDSGHSGGQQPG